MISLRSDFDDLEDELNEIIIEGKAAVARTSNFIVRSASQRMINKIRNVAKSGRVYGTHVASAPGEAPADFTGYLASTIRHTEMTDNASSTADVTVSASYADTLEFGGFNESGRYIEPRPFMEPSIREALIAGDKQFDKELRKMR